MKTSLDSNTNIVIPKALIWAQCFAFIVLYGFWILPEIVAFRNSALVLGALASLYPIYQARHYLRQKQAITVWLVLGLFIWASFHLLFLSQDFSAQLLEFGRIWKYAALGAIFAVGLGVSLSSSSQAHMKDPFWRMVYLGLSIPALTYLIKYTLTNYGARFGIDVPLYWRIYFSSQPYYIQKTDYIAFCLPVIAISLGQIKNTITMRAKLLGSQWLSIAVYAFIILVTLFLFYAQDTKNGIAYATLLFILFIGSLIFQKSSVSWVAKLAVIALTSVLLGSVLYPHVQKNPTWTNLIADTKVGFATDQYPHWKYAGEQGYPNNEYARTVSITTYERAAWFKVGSILAVEHPAGYGLVEDSFKKMVIRKWADASTHLSHSHSGWLDIILAVGFPGFLCLFSALIGAMFFSRKIQEPWGSVVYWSMAANLILAFTTEIATTTTFPALIFWVSLACGLTVVPVNRGQK